MRKLNKELRSNLLKLYPSICEIEIQDFFNLIGDSIVTWGLLGNKVLFPAMQLSLLLGKYRSDYSANWATKGKADSFKGKHYQLEGKELERYKADISSRFKGLRIVSGTWLLDWERAYDYVCRSARTAASISNINSQNYIILQGDILYIDSRAISQQLGISHESLSSLLYKYEDKISLFGPLQAKEEIIVNEVKAVLKKKYYLFNEDQAYLIGTLARNTDTVINFKVWLVQQFSKAREILLIKEGHESSEAIIHRYLAQLTLYTSIKANSEYPLPINVPNSKGNKSTESIKRIDLFLNHQVAIELKKDKINIDHITDIIGNRGYYHTLKKIPTFKYLIICSPAGISHGASKMLEIMHPRVIFLEPHQIGDRIAQQALKEYPPKSHWWLKSMVFPKFSKVLSKEFLDSLETPTGYRLPESLE